MKSKKFLLGALIAVAIGSSAFNLWAQTRESCKWHFTGNCSNLQCTWGNPGPGEPFCTYWECIGSVEPC